MKKEDFNSIKRAVQRKDLHTILFFLDNGINLNNKQCDELIKLNDTTHRSNNINHIFFNMKKFRIENGLRN